MSEELPDVLLRWVEAETGATLMAAATIGAGASRRIWLVHLDHGRPLVVREDTGDGPVAGTPLDLRREATVYTALRSTDLPVPTLRAVRRDGDALLLDRARGVEHFKHASDADRQSVTEDYGRCLGRLHLLDPDDLDLGPLAVPADGRPAVVADLALWQGIHESRSGTDGADATPGVAIALQWLLAHAPAGSGRPSLCHGDAGPGNFLHEHGRVTALLDWEFAHVDDPHDDLAWVAVRNQVLRRPIDVGVVHRAWRDTTGRPIDVALLEYHRAVVLVRMLISCDATIAWAGETAPAARVQTALRPFLAVALLEALRRAGCPPDNLAHLDAPARARWEASPVAAVLGDPSDLDDLGATL